MSTHKANNEEDSLLAYRVHAARDRSAHYNSKGCTDLVPSLEHGKNILELNTNPNPSPDACKTSRNENVMTTLRGDNQPFHTSDR